MIWYLDSAVHRVRIIRDGGTMIAATPSNLAAEPPGGSVQPAQAAGGVAALLLLSACAAGSGQHTAAGSGQHTAAGSGQDPARGTVTGRLVREGGPLGPGGQQPGAHPIPGTIRFTAGQHRVIMVRTSRAGRFSVQLPAGKYQVADRSPRLLLVAANGIARQTWSRPVTVTVTGHHVTRITLVIAVP
jgi:hypothetical protein